MLFVFLLVCHALTGIPKPKAIKNAISKHSNKNSQISSCNRAYIKLLLFNVCHFQSNNGPGLKVLSKLSVISLFWAPFSVCSMSIIIH